MGGRLPRTGDRPGGWDKVPATAGSLGRRMCGLRLSGLGSHPRPPQRSSQPHCSPTRVKATKQQGGAAQRVSGHPRQSPQATLITGEGARSCGWSSHAPGSVGGGPGPETCAWLRAQPRPGPRNAYER